MTLTAFMRLEVTRICTALVLCAIVTMSIAAPDVDAGRRMYRDGLLPSGQPLTAIVAGDVEILGTQFSCESCHGRSGMGATEGSYIVPPIAGQFLFVESPQPPRPAYTNKSLARLLRKGVTPGGRDLGELMPRYKMSDEHINDLADYLRTLSAGNSPGVDNSTIHFATVVTDEVAPDERAAVMQVIRRFAEDINRETRNDSGRWDRGYTPESKLHTVFREWVIDEWVLTGPEQAWSDQLESYYADQPVFALVSGLSDVGWAPVGRFCERHEIACLLPSVDLPEQNDGDFYTLHFSRGLELEAGLIAEHIGESGAERVVQFYCDSAPSKAAAYLHRVLEAKSVTVHDIIFDCRDGLPFDALSTQAGQDSAPVVLWTDGASLESLVQPVPAARVYLSSTLLNADVPSTPATTGQQVFMAYPYVLPGKPDPALRRFEFWARTRNVELTHPRQQAEAFFACLVLNDSVKHMGRFFVRDFALDMLDHAPGLMAYLPYHPRPTVGPGQRFLTKGGYVLPVVDGQLQVADAQWILP